MKCTVNLWRHGILQPKLFDSVKEARVFMGNHEDGDHFIESITMGYEPGGKVLWDRRGRSCSRRKPFDSTVVMTTQELTAKLNALVESGDELVNHKKADALLLEFIDDKDVCTAFAAIQRGYA